MAKQKRVYINKPMLDALRKLMLRADQCPKCNRDWEEHSWLQFTQSGTLAGCSNEEG